MGKRLSLAIALVIFTYLALAGVAAAPGPRQAAKGGTPTTGVALFVDWVGPPPPIMPPSGATYTDQSPLFKVFRSGSKWPSTPVSYVVDGTGAPSGAAAAVIAGFTAWDEATTATLFSVSSVTTAAGTWGCAAAGSVGSDPDGVNSVFWADLSGTSLAGALAVTCTVFEAFPTYTNIIEFDVVFNSAYLWSTSGESDKFDVQNVAAHEAGHTLWLDDLYQPSASELTMYGYVAPEETKKQSLGVGDTKGVQFLYGP